MRRHHVRRALGAARLSPFEIDSLVAGILLIVAGPLAAAAVALAGGHPGGLARALALAGLSALAVSGVSHGIRLLRGPAISLPASIGRTEVRVRPARSVGVITVALALVLPFAVCIAALVLIDAAWIWVVGALAVGSAGTIVTGMHKADDRPYAMFSARGSELLGRLCMRADIPRSELVVENGPVATAWTAGGQVHVTSALLRLLDDRELEAVLAHEVAHLASRDAAAMEVCSAPSRFLLGFAEFLTPRLVPWTRNILKFGPSALAVAIWLLAALCVPPAFVVGWISRLSVLNASRAREFSADAAAATLTGRPSALASALMKLEGQREWAPSADLRQVDAYAVLCIVAARRPRLGRLFSTHPRTDARVSRLGAIEAELQQGRRAL